MLILTTGSRTWNNPELIREQLVGLTNSIVMNGACKDGADYIVNNLIDEWFPGVTPLRIPADWNQYGKAAGPIRNKEMVDYLPEKVLAFWDGKSAGTKGTIDFALEKGLEVTVVSPDGKKQFYPQKPGVCQICEISSTVFSLPRGTHWHLFIESIHLSTTEDDLKREWGRIASSVITKDKEFWLLKRLKDKKKEEIEKYNRV